MTWSPDSKWLAFTTIESSDEDLTPQLRTFIFNRNGEKIAEWDIGGQNLAWSPNSNWLAINAFKPETAINTILLVNVEDLQVFDLNISGDLTIIDWLAE
ncbi:MAG: hypothetical protein AB1509_01045 [Chloroflexota bacterium]|nr:hypothetical protein [Chloroflexota bacterium]WKZ36205.1 MAG: hypothetical protein QY332_21595 [Anaerolineales bacterium]